LRAGEGFCKYLLCQKTRVGDGGELERALDDAIGAGSVQRYDHVAKSKNHLKIFFSVTLATLSHVLKF